MGEAIRFWHRGRLVDVTDAPPTETVLSWLRRTRVSVGTKEGCNEGDCGACAVVIGELDAGGSLTLHSVHACLLLMPMLHGRALITIEDVDRDGHLHPVQQSLVDHFGTQCGYCTPGIVMSLWRMHEDAARAGRTVTEAEVRTGLAGHLCRCTGYRSIVEAAVAAGSSSVASLDPAPVATALGQIPADDVLDYTRDGARLVAPVTVDALVELRAAMPDAVVIAGGTDLVATLPAGGDLPASLLWTGRLRALAEIDECDGDLRLGAGASIESAWSACASRWPGLVDGWLRFASPAVRSVGTLGGNLVTASPVGDTAPVLLALDARLVLRSVDGERTVPMREFVTGYRHTAMRPDEVLVRVDIPLAPADRDVRMFKVARRYDNDIATVSLATALRVVDDCVVHVRAAFGGMADVPLRATAVEEALLGRPWDRAAVAAAQRAVREDCVPLSDHRGSSDYRLSLASGLLERWWLLTRPGDPLATAQVDVWRSS